MCVLCGARPPSGAGSARRVAALTPPGVVCSLYLFMPSSHPSLGLSLFFLSACLDCMPCERGGVRASVLVRRPSISYGDDGSFY